MQKISSIFFACCICAVSLTHGQNSGWRAYSPVDGGFSVEIPKVEIEVVKRKDPKWENSLLNGVTGFLAYPPNDDLIRYSVLRIDLNGIPDLYNSSMKISEKELLSYFAVMYTGDDDESQFLSEPKSIKNGSLVGTEYTFIDDTGPGRLYTRSRLFVRGRNLYIVRFEGQNPTELNSRDSSRFLSSFRLLPR